MDKNYERRIAELENQLADSRQEITSLKLAVRAENQYHFCFGDHGLMIASFYQPFFNSLIGDVQNGVKLLIACSVLFSK